MHSCNILHWSQFLRSIARILRDRNYYSLNVKHYSYTIEVWRSGLGFPERVSSQWQWPLFYSQTQSGSSVETQTLEIRVVRAKNRAEWLAQCGPRLASYYKWLYVTHWEKCECEASQQEQSQLLFNLIIPTSMQPLLLLTPQHLKASLSSDLDSPCVVFLSVLSDVECYS